MNNITYPIGISIIYRLRECGNQNGFSLVKGGLVAVRPGFHPQDHWPRPSEGHPSFLRLYFGQHPHRRTGGVYQQHSQLRVSERRHGEDRLPHQPHLPRVAPKTHPRQSRPRGPIRNTPPRHHHRGIILLPLMARP